MAMIPEVLVVMKERGQAAYYNGDIHPISYKADNPWRLGGGNDNALLLMNIYDFGGYALRFQVVRV
jgi:hypothetical protein